MLTKERRKHVRRQADMDLQDRIRAFGGAEDHEYSHEQRKLRRRAIRHNCEMQIALQFRHSAANSDTWTPAEHPIKGRMLDLSAVGCLVFTGEQLEAGQELRLIISLRGGATIQARGNIRWIKIIRGKNGYAAGLHFREVSPQDQKRIETFLKELDETIGL